MQQLFSLAGKPEALDGLLVVELADEKAQYCGKLLADLGADVYKVEPPGGATSRYRAPYGGRTGSVVSLPFVFYNSGKKSVTLDVEEPGGRQKLLDLLRRADVFIETLPGQAVDRLGLGYQALAILNPRLVVASVTGFGRTGPYRDFRDPEIVTYAMGGLMFQSGSPDHPPVVGPCEQSYQFAAMCATYGILVALYDRATTGRGQHVELSIQEGQASQQHILVNYSALAQIIERRGGQARGGGAPGGIFPTKDGYVHLHVLAPRMWKRFLDWMGRPEVLADPVWENRHFRSLNADVIEPFVAEFFVTFTKEELYREGQKRGIPIAPVNAPSEFMADRQVVERGLFQEADDPLLGPHRFPGAPFLMSETPLRRSNRLATLGQDNESVSSSAFRVSSATGGVSSSAFRVSSEASDPKPETRNPKPRRPLDGIRVLDFTQALAGPFVTRLLGEFGAEVIKVESETHQQRGRAAPGLDQRVVLQQQVTWTDTNRNKLGISLDMSKTEAQAVMQRLVRAADVMVDNFSPRVLTSWGLSYDKIREINPRLIMMSMPGFGMSGPSKEYVSVAGTVMALTGMTYLWGYPDYAQPVGTQTFQADYGAGAHGLVAVLAALIHRLKSGRGQYIDQAQIETVASIFGPAYLDASVNRRDPTPTGNRSPDWAPQGCYPSKNDGWCVIAVTSDEEWQRFCDLLGRPSWAVEEQYASNAERLANQDSLDAHISEWTRGYTRHQVMWMLQRGGVPAGAVQSPEDLFCDLQLRHRGFLQTIPGSDSEGVEFPGVFVHLSETPGAVAPAADFAEHNRYVFQEVAGLSESELEELERQGVLR